MRTKSITPHGQLPRFKGLQLLRITAAMMVVFLHSTFYIRERLYPEQSLWAAGRAGVDIFFVLSGFVMIYTSQNLTSTVSSWRIFAKRRLARVVPLYWLLLTVKFLLLIVSPKHGLHAQLGIWPVISSFLFLPSFNAERAIEPIVGVGWTLNFEMFFYMLFTIALALRVNVYRFVGIILLILSIGEFLRQPEWPAASFYLDSIVLEFFLGMLIGRAVIKNRFLSIPFAACSLVSGCVLLWVNAHGPESVPSLFRYGIPAVLLVLGTVAFEQYLRGVPRTILYLAEASYAIYLVHPMFAPIVPALLFKLHIMRNGVALALSLLTALAGGLVVHNFIELPLNRAVSSIAFSKSTRPR